MANYELPKFLHPDFIEPRRKPVGPVVVDWDNPLTRGLTAAYNLTPDPGVNLVKGSIYGHASLNTTTTLARGGILCDGNKECLLTDAVVAIPDKGTSLAVWEKTAGGPTFSDLFFSSTFDGHSLYWDSVSGNVRINGTEVPGVPSPKTFPIDGKNHVIGFNWDYTNDVYNAWINKETDQHTAAHSVPAADFVAMGGRDNLDSRYSSGLVKAVWHWDRVLTPAEHRSMAENPYQLLKPAIPQYAFLEEATTSLVPYELPKFMHPDFADPKRKPSGPVVVDWDNPITRDLAVCTIFDSMLIENFAGNPRLGIEPGIVATTNEVSFASELGGRVLNFHTSGGTFGIEYVRFENASPDDTTDFTLITLTRAEDNFSAPGNKQLGRRTDTGTNDNFRLQLTSDINLQLVYFDDRPAGNSHNLTIPTMAQFDTIFAAGTKTGGVIQSFAGVKGGPLVTTTPTDTGESTFRAGSEVQYPGRGVEGTVKGSFMFAWNRALSETEIQAIYADPYGALLKPAVPQYAFLEAGAEGWSIANIDLDDDVFDGQTGAIIAISGTVAASGKKVFIEQGVNTVEQTVTAEDASSATITIGYGGLLTNGAATLLVRNPL